MKTLPKARILVTRFPFEARMGGEEIHTLKLMEALDKRGYEAFFLGSCPVLLKAFKVRNFWIKKAWIGKPPVSLSSLIIFTLLSPYLFLRASHLLRKVKKEWGVTVLYALSFGDKLLMTPWAHLCGMKVIWLEHARIGPWLTKNPWRFVYKFLSRLATVVVTSNAMLSYVRPYAHTVKAISCAVLTEKMEPLPQDILDFIKGGISVGSVARLTADKGVDILVACVQSKPGTRLILVGDGPLKELVQKSIDSDRLMLVPSLSRGQLMSLYQSLDIFVLASMKMDPFGMVAAEAMAMGTPVLLTQVCGISSDLTDGKEAIIVEPKRSEIDKGLKKLLKHQELRRQLGEQGKFFVEKHYRLEEMVREFEKIL